MQLGGCNLIRAHHSIQNEVVLSLVLLTHYVFSKCIICEVSVQNRMSYIGVIWISKPRYHSFESFLSVYEKVLSDITFLAILYLP